MSPSEFAAVLIPILSSHGASVTSWYRTRHHNAAVGGAPNSCHLRAQAVDVVLDAQVDAAALIASCVAAGLRATQERDHIHITTSPHA